MNFHFDWNDRYNLWSGLIGGMFLALSYFGCDQSQVQRYLTGKSIAQSKLSLLFTAMAKIPMQFFILFIGAMVFVFYIFEPAPMVFQRIEYNRIRQPELRARYEPIAARYQEAFARRKAEALAIVEARHRRRRARRERGHRRLSPCAAGCGRGAAPGRQPGGSHRRREGLPRYELHLSVIRDAGIFRRASWGW